LLSRRFSQLMQQEGFKVSIDKLIMRMFKKFFDELYFLQTMVLSSNKPIDGRDMFITNSGGLSKLHIDYNLKKTEEDIKKEKKAMNENRMKEILANIGRTELSKPMDGYGKNSDIVCLSGKKTSVVVSDLYSPFNHAKASFNKPTTGYINNTQNTQNTQNTLNTPKNNISHEQNNKNIQQIKRSQPHKIHAEKQKITSINQYINKRKINNNVATHDTVKENNMNQIKQTEFNTEIKIDDVKNVSGIKTTVQAVPNGNAPNMLNLVEKSITAKTVIQQKNKNNYRNKKIRSLRDML
jgi:hypothetical protein